MKDRYCDNGLQEILTQAIDQMKDYDSGKFDIEKITPA